MPQNGCNLKQDALFHRKFLKEYEEYSFHIFCLLLKGLRLGFMMGLGLVLVLERIQFSC